MRRPAVDGPGPCGTNYGVMVIDAPPDLPSLVAVMVAVRLQLL
jgi:hypothetical protein